MLLSAENVHASYGEKAVLDGVSLSFEKGEIVGVKGGNGSGKSTLCRLLAGLPPEGLSFSGKIEVNGEDVFSISVARRSAQIGIVFQNPENQLFSPSVESELAFAPENLCVPRAEIAKRIDYALKILQIEHLRDRQTNSLSGGEKQLTAIASVLTMQPEIIIADEITARIDESGREKIRCFLKAFAAAGGLVITVSHIESDLAQCTRIIDFDRGAGI